MAETVVSIRCRTIVGIGETDVTLAVISSTVPLASTVCTQKIKHQVVKNAAEIRRISFPTPISERAADAEMHAVTLLAVRQVDTDRSDRRLDAQAEPERRIEFLRIGIPCTSKIRK